MYLSESKIQLYADILYPQLGKPFSKTPTASILAAVDKQLAGKIDVYDCLDIAGKIIYCLWVLHYKVKAPKQTPLQLPVVRQSIAPVGEGYKPLVGIGGQGMKSLVEQMPKIALSAYQTAPALPAHVVEYGGGVRQILAGFKEVMLQMAQTPACAAVSNLEVLKQLYKHAFGEEIVVPDATLPEGPQAAQRGGPIRAETSMGGSQQSRGRWRRKLSFFGGRDDVVV